MKWFGPCEGLHGCICFGQNATEVGQVTTSAGKEGTKLSPLLDTTVVAFQVQQNVLHYLSKLAVKPTPAKHLTHQPCTGPSREICTRVLLSVKREVSLVALRYPLPTL